MNVAFPEANIGFLIELYTGRIEASSPGTLPQGMAVADLGHFYAHILERRHGRRVVESLRRRMRSLDDQEPSL